MRHRWETRYSPSEMMYLEVADGEVRLWLHHAPEGAERHTFESVLGGSLDGEVGNVFGRDVLEELKAAVRAWTPGLPPVLDKKAEMLRRRREG
ncbi:MAG: hypothetical protein HRU70_02420 [Phycisphaeraceae bacterium]|nr:MAG: hypothetical protein HRU70_02420 [Phycisphaeraceae bacterium]